MCIIKTKEELYDLSGDHPGFVIPAGTELLVDSDEGDYWIVAYNDESFPVMKDEAEIVEKLQPLVSGNGWTVANV